MAMMTCTYHCSPCGGHFHSLEAFDLHHTRDAKKNAVCHDPRGIRELVALSEHGICRAYDPVKLNVTVWTTKRSLAVDRSNWAKELTSA